MAANETAATFFSNRLPVQPFPSGDAWVNTARPIKLDQLRGKFVLLDFWTLGCINCMHVIPELKKIEAAWPKDLVVIGVHSAKFQEEKNTKIIAQAVLRYGLQHPVINDGDYVIWKSFGIQAWPSLVLIDPEGYAVWGHSGEITFDQLDNLLKPAVAYYRKKGLLDEKPLVFEPESKRAASAPLSFPGKLLADEAGNRLFIADSGHNRIVIARLDGTLLDTIGDGRRGLTDGDYEQARFNSPQGMALKDNMLYVADTENHLIRKVDLIRKARNHNCRHRTSKPAGAAFCGFHSTTENGVKQSLGVVHTRRRALHCHGRCASNMEDAFERGHHRRLCRQRSGRHRGRPACARQPYELGFASFAQPSGLASDGVWLYVADAEGSSIRAVPFDRNKKVRTVVGTAGLSEARLFTFGDADGPAPLVKLQHPLGIACHEGRLYIADTYNNKIKVIDPLSGDTQTLVGTGAADYADSPPALNNPSGLATADAKLFVADTNNHRIRVIDLNKGMGVSTLEIAGLKPPASADK